MSTLTLNLDARHDEVLTSLAAEQELSKTALLRQALRLYQTVHLELKRGRQLAFQNPDGSFVSMVMLGGPMAAEAAPAKQEAALRAVFNDEGKCFLATKTRDAVKAALTPPAVAAPAVPKTCRMDDGRCGICGGDWSVCGCEGMLRRAAASRETGEGDAR